MRYGPDMTPDPSTVKAENKARQQDQVLEREGLEEELMDEGRSEAGEHIDGVDEAKEA